MEKSCVSLAQKKIVYLKIVWNGKGMHYAAFLSFSTIFYYVKMNFIIKATCKNNNGCQQETKPMLTL